GVYFPWECAVATLAPFRCLPTDEAEIRRHLRSSLRRIRRIRLATASKYRRPAPTFRDVARADGTAGPSGRSSHGVPVIRGAEESLGRLPAIATSVAQSRPSVGSGYS